MRLVKNGKIVSDSYQRVLDDAPIPEEGAIIIPALRFLADADELAKRSTPIGVTWPNNKPLSELEPYLDKIALVGLVFPTFKDGRAYSQARILRERYRFRGELRATGQVLRDQFLFLLRAGFDSFEVVKDADARAFEEAIRRYSIFYQPAADGELPAFRRRTAVYRAEPVRESGIARV
jgi:uncharacterized protein (DUF934 family)